MNCAACNQEIADWSAVLDICESAWDGAEGHVCGACAEKLFPAIVASIRARKAPILVDWKAQREAFMAAEAKAVRAATRVARKSDKEKVRAFVRSLSEDGAL